MKFKLYKSHIYSNLIKSPWNINTRVENGTTKGISRKIVTVLNSLTINGGPSSENKE